MKISPLILSINTKYQVDTIYIVLCYCTGDDCPGVRWSSCQQRYNYQLRFSPPPSIRVITDHDTSIMSTNPSHDNHHVTQFWPIGAWSVVEFSWHVNHVTGYRPADPGNYHGTQFQTIRKVTTFIWSFGRVVKIFSFTIANEAVALSLQICISTMF